MKLCLTGKAGSGKTSIALEYERKGYIRLAFATPVKEFACEILRRPIEKTDPKDREFLQKLGTDVGRWRDKDIWVKHFADNLAEAKIITGQDDFFVVDDARFQNEVDYLRSQGFVVVKVLGRGYDMGELSQHISESGVDAIKPDFTVDNSGELMDTLDELEAKFQSFVSSKNDKGNQ